MRKINLGKQRMNLIPVAHSYLTRRQYRIMEMYCDGYAKPKIAKLMCITHKTIDSHLLSAKERLGASTLHQAIAIFAASERHLKVA